MTSYYINLEVTDYYVYLLHLNTAKITRYKISVNISRYHIRTYGTHNTRARFTVRYRCRKVPYNAVLQ